MMWDSPDFRVQRDVKLREWLLGNEDAIRVCVQTSHIAEVWDDLHDGDREPTDREVAHAFESAMIHLQTNPFYMANHAMLMGLIVLMANAWHDANEMTESPREVERMMAFHLRNMGIEMVQLCAFIVGGYEHMRRVSLEIRRYFIHETFREWDHAALQA